MPCQYLLRLVSDAPNDDREPKVRAVLPPEPSVAHTRGPFDGAPDRDGRGYLRSEGNTARKLRQPITFVTADKGERCSISLGASWTLSCWLKLPLPTYTARDSYKIQIAAGAASAHLQLRLLPTGEVRVGVLTAGAHRACELGGTDLQMLPHGWHQLAAVGEGGTTTLYLNGRRVSSIGALVCDPVRALFQVVGLPAAADGVGVYDVRLTRGALDAGALAELGGGGARVQPKEGIFCVPVLIEPKQPSRAPTPTPSVDASAPAPADMAAAPAAPPKRKSPKFLPCERKRRRPRVPRAPASGSPSKPASASTSALESAFASASTSAPAPEGFTDGTPLYEGMRVEARFQAAQYGNLGTHFFEGKVTKVHDGGRFADVAYDDGDREERVPAKYIKDSNGKQVARPKAKDRGLCNMCEGCTLPRHHAGLCQVVAGGLRSNKCSGSSLLLSQAAAIAPPTQRAASSGGAASTAGGGAAAGGGGATDAALEVLSVEVDGMVGRRANGAAKAGEHGGNADEDVTAVEVEVVETEEEDDASTSVATTDVASVASTVEASEAEEAAEAPAPAAPALSAAEAEGAAEAAAAAAAAAVMVAVT